MAGVKDSIKDSLRGTIVPDPTLPVTSRIRAHFHHHSRIDSETEERYMNEEDFINAIAPVHEDYHKIKREQYGILFRVADRRKTGKVNLHDWAAFENLIAKPDAEYEIAFRLFDVEGTGAIKYETFQKLYKENTGSDSIPFDWNSEWASLYTGTKKRRHDMTYPQFAQMLRGLQGERIRQAFHLFDMDGDGYIEPEDFQRIILKTSKHKLSDHVLDNLPSLCTISAGSKISYANVRAFQNIIREMDMIDNIVRSAISKSHDGKITRTDFLNEAARIARFSLFTPMEADILFHFAGLDTPSGKLSLNDFAKVVDASWHSTAAALGNAAVEGATQAADKATTKSKQVLHSILGFGFTLAAYEVLQKWLPLPGSHAEEVTPIGHIEPGLGQRATGPLPYIRSRNALKLILDLDENFGRIKVPKGAALPGGAA
ncbi:mitochondrial inner membrane protein [Histoplasma capsulatum]|uniref:Mitochondrial inner membrane protein n=1 Tax=Ajellomyces capsulatus TaxID=5037 RepID=A0A8A1MAS8_AJECA|nr:mitochondrial inner membrane protein [Histoplasma capsulatum]